MIDADRLTPKQNLFLKELVATFEPTEAAMRVYDCKNRHVASNIASENMAKLGITLVELMDKMGLNEEEDVKDLKRLRKAKRVLGYIHQYKKDEDGKTEKMSPDEAVSPDFLEVDDNPTQIKALELTCKIKGNLNNNVVHSGSISTGETKIYIITQSDDKKGIDAKPTHNPSRIPKEICI